MKKESPDVCSQCNTVLTVKHILVDFPLYDNERLLNGVPTTHSAMLSDNTQTIYALMNYLTQTNLLQTLWKLAYSSVSINLQPQSNILCHQSRTISIGESTRSLTGPDQHAYDVYLPTALHLPRNKTPRPGRKFK